MRLKSFHAKTMSAALKLVRDALGEDAIIVASREDELTGGVRVTAAIEDDYHPSQAQPQARPNPATAFSDPAPGPLRGPRFGAGDGGAPAGGGGRAPNTHAQGGRSAPGPNFGANHTLELPEDDLAEQISDALYRNGTPPRVTDALIAQVQQLDTTDPVLALAGALDAAFSFQPLGEPRPGRPLMIVGPPGAGKTMVVAKMAARAVMRGRRVGVMTTDTVRAGGVEQLAAFTRLLKLDLLEIDDLHSLGDGLLALRGEEQVIIDTAGRNPFNEDDMTSLAEAMRVADIEPILVMAAGGDAHEAAVIAKIFYAVGCRRMLLTRLDMTRRLGSILNAAYEARLGFCDVSLTAKVADGLTPLNPVSLARLLLPKTERGLGASAQTGAARQTGTY
jgi:flagellar biosynthesis protein FlhF